MAAPEVEIPTNVIAREQPSLFPSTADWRKRLERVIDHHARCQPSACDQRFLLDLFGLLDALGGAKRETAPVNCGASLPPVPANPCACALHAASVSRQTSASERLGRGADTK